MKARLVEQRGFHKMRVAVVRPGDIADPLGEVLWEEYVDIDPEMQPKLEAARIEGERQLKFFNGGSDGGDRGSGEREGQGGGGIAPGGDGPGGSPETAAKVLELPRVQPAPERVPAQVADDGADPGPGAGGADPGVPVAGDVPGDEQGRVVRGVGDGASATPGEAVDPPRKASVTMLRPELMKLSQLLRVMADEIDREGEAGPQLGAVVLFRPNGTTQQVVKATPEQCALAGAHLTHFALSVSLGIFPGVAKGPAA